MENCDPETVIPGRGLLLLRHLALFLLFIFSGCIVPGERGGTPSLEVTSGAFTEGGRIPVEYTCDGADISPPLSWGQVPAGTRSIALLVTDPDAAGRPFVHWAVYNIPPGTRDLPAGTAGTGALPGSTRQGTNDFGRTGYGGPCPPAGKPHHYHFTVSALDTALNLTGRQDGRALGAALVGHVLARGEIVGLYQRA